MNTMTIEAQNINDVKNSPTILQQINGASFERIPGLPYTLEEKLASIAKSDEEFRMGLGISSEQLGKEIATW
jgi:hypothetical protein